MVKSSECFILSYKLFLRRPTCVIIAKYFAHHGKTECFFKKKNNNTIYKSNTINKNTIEQKIKKIIICKYI